MQPEILLFDIGNTSIKIGLANERHVLTSYTLRTDTAQTADNFGLTLLTLLQHAGVTASQLKACVASSVAPGFDPLLREGTRAAGPFTALWYLLFMIPFALWVRETPGPRAPLRLGAAMADLWRLLISLRHRRSLRAWLLSSMFLRDALNALYAFGGIFAGTVLGWPVIWAGAFGIVSAISAAIVSWIGGRADRRWGPKPVIIISTLVLTAVCVLIAGLGRQQVFGLPLSAESRLPDVLFFLCGALIGGAGGALQAAARTMMVRHTTPARATEAFGLYALSGKATAFLAPWLIARATQATGNQSLGVFPLIVMFLLALVLLSWVQSKGEAQQ